MDKGPGKSCSNKRDKHDELEVTHQGEQNVRTACPKDELHGIQVFFVSPVNHGLPQVYTDVLSFCFVC